MLMLHFLLKQTNLWVKLLFRPGVAVLASFSPLTFTGIPPLLTLLHSWTRQRSAAVKSQYTTTLNNNKSYWIKMFGFFLTVWCNTCICACVGCASCPCCCGSTDRHNLDGTGEAAFYRAPFCSGTARSFGLGVTRQTPRATVRPEDRETVDTEGAFHTRKAKVWQQLFEEWLMRLLWYLANAVPRSRSSRWGPCSPPAPTVRLLHLLLLNLRHPEFPWPALLCQIQPRGAVSNSSAKHTHTRHVTYRQE